MVEFAHNNENKYKLFNNLCQESFILILIGSGSELECCTGAAEILRQQGKKVRVVSMPSWELFEKQSDEYKKSVLPCCCKKRISVEGGSTFGWTRYIGDEGLAIGLDHFGDSAPAGFLADLYGFTAAKVAEKALAYLK